MKKKRRSEPSSDVVQPTEPELRALAGVASAAQRDGVVKASLGEVAQKKEKKKSAAVEANESGDKETAPSLTAASPSAAKSEAPVAAANGLAGAEKAKGKKGKKRKAAVSEASHLSHDAPALPVSAVVSEALPATEGAGASPGKSKKKKRRLNVGQLCAASPIGASGLPATKEVASPLEEGATNKKRKKKADASAPDASTTCHPIPEAPAPPKVALDRSLQNGVLENKKKKKQKTAAVSEWAIGPLSAAQPASATPEVDKKDEKKKERKKKTKKDERGNAEESGAPPAEPGAGATPAVGAAGAAREQHGAKAKVNDAGSGQRAFQRVVAEEWLGHKAARDNSYAGTFGAAGWGAGAQAVLGQVRGKDFRHEKTKKKRGTYRGGAIETGAVHSFKFDSDDDA